MATMRSQQGTRRVRRSEPGLTLVELMVTILLAAIMVAGLFYMVSGQQRTYSQQVKNLTAQENLWGAMEFMQRSIREAGEGIGGCGGRIVKFKSGAMIDLKALKVYNNFNLSTGAVDGTDSFSTRGAARALPNIDAGTSTLRLTKQSTTLSGTSLHLNDAFDDIQGTQSIAFHNGDLVMVCDPTGSVPATMLQLTKEPEIKADGKVKLEFAKSSPYNLSPSGTKHDEVKYPEGSLIVRVGPDEGVRNFAIKNNVNPPLLVTWVTGGNLEIVAAGIEDMQIAWACDGNGDHIVDEGPCVGASGGAPCLCSVNDCSAKKNDEWGGNVDADNTPVCNGDPIRRVRITLIARTAGPMVGDRNGSRPEAEDHVRGTVANDLAAAGGVGTYGRAVLTSEVVPRNIANPVNSATGTSSGKVKWDREGDDEEKENHGHKD